MTIDDLHQVRKNSKIIIRQSEIETALNKLAEQLNNDYEDKNPLFLIVLNGGLIFSGQLLPKIDILCQIDYCHATRYQGKRRGAKIQWKTKPQMNLANRDVIIIDDILDEGHTLASISDYCFTNNANSVKTLVLVEKQHQRKSYQGQKADYCELNVPDKYVFGFGMDYFHHWRNLKDIFICDDRYIEAK